MIRRALASDRLAAIRMARDFHAVSGAPFAFSAAHAEAVFLACVDADERLVLILDVADSPSGLLVAHVEEHPFGAFRVAREVIWWVDPPARGQGTALLDAYEAWARGQGCSAVHMASLDADPALSRLYSRRGYRVAETHFLKAL